MISRNSLAGLKKWVNARYISPLPNHNTLPPTHELESEPELVPTAIGATVEELYAAYEADKVVAAAKFMDKILRVAGIVDKIAVTDIPGIPILILVSAENKRLAVLCEFDKKHRPELDELTAGQRVTVQGKCDGHRIYFLLRDCVLVR